MRNKSTQGFTLIELLIVIAIIGILAAVLIPNLLGARRTAQVRAAQAHNSNVYTAAQAYLAENVNAVPSDADNADCTGGVTYGNYTVGAAPSLVTACTVVGTDATGVVTVTSTIPDGNIVNGQAP